MNEIGVKHNLAFSFRGIFIYLYAFLCCEKVIMSDTWVIRIRNSQQNEDQEMTLCTEYLDSRIRIVILRNNCPPVLGEVSFLCLFFLI